MTQNVTEFLRSFKKKERQKSLTHNSICVTKKSYIKNTQLENVYYRTQSEPKQKVTCFIDTLNHNSILFLLREHRVKAIKERENFIWRQTTWTKPWAASNVKKR